MRVFLAAALLLALAACDRSNTAHRAAAAPPPAPAANATVPVGPAVAANPASTTQSAPGHGVASTSKIPAQNQPGALRPYENDPPPYDEAKADGKAVQDFRAQQEQRDRELLERDAQEAVLSDREIAQDDDVGSVQYGQGGASEYDDRAGAAEYDQVQGPESAPPPDQDDVDEPPYGDEYPPDDGYSDYPPADDYGPDEDFPPDDDY